MIDKFEDGGFVPAEEQKHGEGDNASRRDFIHIAAGAAAVGAGAMMVWPLINSMKINAKVYKDISPDMNVSDSEAESTDEELQDTDLSQYRTNTLKHKYKDQATTKHNNEMKQHLIQQKGFTTTLFDGTPKSLETLLVEM